VVSRYRHMYWTALSFLAACAFTGGVAGSAIVLFRTRIHDALCACGVDLDLPESDDLAVAA